jgi:hypothetical protein
MQCRKIKQWDFAFFESRIQRSTSG